MKNYKRSSLALSVMAAIALAGCNSSSDNPPPPPPGEDNPPVYTQGKFVDTVVEGLHYVALPSEKNGTTNVNGQYEMEEGDVLHFYLGGESGLHIGSVSPRDVVSPFEATGTYRRAVNLAVLLQSLDENKENNDLIKLPDDLINIEESDEDLLELLQSINLDNFTTVEEFLLRIFGDATKIVSEEEAIEHLNNSLENYERGDNSKMSNWSKASGKYLRSTYVLLTLV